MNAAATVSDYHWLVSPEAAPLLADAHAESRPLLAQLESLRHAVSPERAHLILEQIELRRRAIAKFSLAEQLFFDPLALEQSTDGVTACYKAERFPTEGPVADLCCGIGGDLMALAMRGKAIGIERNEKLAVLAATNACVVRDAAGQGGPADVVVRACDVREFDLASVAAWHIDPDRRPAGKRTTRIELHEPSSAVWTELLQRNANGAIKLAPAAELPLEWQAEHELEWISRDGSCRQLVVWCGALAQSPGQRRATVLSGTSGPMRTLVGMPGVVPLQAAPGQYLYEPDAAMLAADLVGTLASEYGLTALIPGGGYLTGNSLLVDPAFASFEVQDVFPYQLKRIKQLLRERKLGRLEVKKRGVDHDPEKLRRELKVPGDNPATLFVTRLATGVTAILTRRLTTK